MASAFEEDEAQQPGIVRSGNQVSSEEEEEEPKKKLTSVEVPEIFSREAELKRFSATLEERIRFLDSLFEQDMLSEEEFVQAKTKLFEEVAEKQQNSGKENLEEEEEEKFFMETKMESMRFTPTKPTATSSTFFETGEQSHLRTLERAKKKAMEEDTKSAEQERLKSEGGDKLSNKLLGMVSSVFGAQTEEKKQSRDDEEDEEKEQAKELGFKALEAPGQAVFAAAASRTRTKPVAAKESDDMEAMQLLQRSLSELDMDGAVEESVGKQTKVEDDQESQGSIGSDLFDSKPKLSKHPSLLLLSGLQKVPVENTTQPETKRKEPVKPQGVPEQSRQAPLRAQPQSQSGPQTQAQAQTSTQMQRQSEQGNGTEGLPTAKPASVFAKLQSLLGTTATTTAATTTPGTGGTGTGSSETLQSTQETSAIPLATRATGTGSATYVGEVAPEGGYSYEQLDEEYMTPGFFDPRTARRERERQREQETRAQQGQNAQTTEPQRVNEQGNGANVSFSGMSQDERVRAQIAQLEEFRAAGALSEEDFNAAQARIYAERYLGEESRRRILAQSNRELAAHVNPAPRKEGRRRNRFFGRKTKEEREQERRERQREERERERERARQERERWRPPQRGSQRPRPAQSARQLGGMQPYGNYSPEVRTQLRELDRFRRNGALSQQQYEEARAATLLLNNLS